MTEFAEDIQDGWEDCLARPAIVRAVRVCVLMMQCYAVVEQDYLAANDDELSLRIGERVAVHSQVFLLSSLYAISAWNTCDASLRSRHT